MTILKETHFGEERLSISVDVMELERQRGDHIPLETHDREASPLRKRVRSYTIKQNGSSYLYHRSHFIKNGYIGCLQVVDLPNYHAITLQQSNQCPYAIIVIIDFIKNEQENNKIGLTIATWGKQCNNRGDDATTKKRCKKIKENEEQTQHQQEKLTQQSSRER